MRYADRVYVMRRGRVALSGSVDEVSARLSLVRTAYLSGAGEPR
jgi:ABC-type branched-subunit amino acid transport system ATPase component